MGIDPKKYRTKKDIHDKLNEMLVTFLLNPVMQEYLKEEMKLNENIVKYIPQEVIDWPI